jgi:predicted metal-dependent enzyme (double-stranded beta helix superfamily)
VTEYLARVPNAGRPLDAFIGDLASLHERFEGDVDRLVEATRGRLAQLVREPDILPAHARAGSPDRYTQHILHVAPDRSHSVVALVWYPGQRTPIHDHVSWCVVGVHEGTESQTLYRLATDADGLCLVETGRETAGPGSCSALIPPAENIHRVANAGADRAISIHVYGADIERLGSSINKTFDDLPVRELAGTSRQAWRGR